MGTFDTKGLEDLVEAPDGFVGEEDDFDSIEDDSKLPQNRYYFRANGKTMSLPLLKFLPVRSALAFEQGRNVEGLLIGADTDEVKEFLQNLQGTAFRRFMRRWEEKSQVTPGESAASSASSASTEGPSSTTSFGRV